jgi:NADH dehydrogenase (ubiquinone) 1 alpha/beta subcomplex 1, acyl-carrier protein
VCRNVDRAYRTAAVQVQTGSSFTEHLGLDSLDTVEVLMAVEEVHPSLTIVDPYLIHCYDQEFGIEIPDEEADEIKTVQQGLHLDSFYSVSTAADSFYAAIDYIAKTPEAR